MTNTNRNLSILAACGLACGMATAQPFSVNITGATAQRAFFRDSLAQGNEFLDVNGNSVTGDNLIPFDVTAPFASNHWWQLQYRAVGSGNGLAELLAWGDSYVTTADGVDLDVTRAADGASVNGTLYYTGTATTGPYQANNPGGAPNRSLTDGSYATVTTTDNSAGTGWQADLATLDVPTVWFATVSGTASPVAMPGAIGYGNNGLVSLNKDGTVNGRTNKLRSLGAYNINTASPDTNTIFDTSITLVPVAAIVNFGVGLQQIDQSDLRHLFASGRRENGENLVAVTRDSGSGTRNAFSNGICLDPSWCVGENIGAQTDDSQLDRLGPNFQPSNKGGSSRNEGTTQNHRLAIGHTAADRGIGSWLTAGRLELLGVRNNVSDASATVYARPTVDNVTFFGLANENDGYHILGPAIIAHIGDPRAASATYGGDSNGNPQMNNPNAAEYVNNITKSIDSFVAGFSVPFTPAEFLASQYLLVAASEFVPNPLNPCELIPNAAFVQAVQDDTRTSGNFSNVFRNAAFTSFNTSSAGLVPQRTSGGSYSDGNAGSDRYVCRDGTFLNYATALPMNLKIAGDFNRDGARTTADTTNLVAALQNPAFNVGANYSPEIIGDFNGDGNFDAEDARYWADGLYLVGGNLDRKAGFTAVDNAGGGNVFGYSATHSTGAAYKAGDARADVASPAVSAGTFHVTKGFVPNGHDGVIGIDDIDYVCANFGDWSNLDDAATIDLSCDMNGDLIVDASDVSEIVVTVLGTQLGDLNLDGTVSSSELATIAANFGDTGTGYSGGDVNCDGIVDNDDYVAAGGCLGDWDASGGQPNSSDFLAFLNDYSAMAPRADLAAPAGVFNSSDFLAFLNLYSQGC
ncbi:MAG: GC-type dockerin domain-anchored protein [Phycisphaerales bacterium]|jgi:hypothetical protein|nr:GC-type dockerin domain-anchored protein [Phycisphaerales bacterium]